MISIKSKPKDYIPEDLDDAVEFLKEWVHESEQKKIASGELDVISGHHSIGRSLRNGWGLWQDSRLAKWFNDRGIGHADDMSGIILDSFQSDLRGEDRKLDEQIEHYRNYWKENGTDPDTIGNLGDDDDTSQTTDK